MIPDHLIPYAFGVVMATVDICMMTLAKLTNTGKIPYLPGIIGATAVYALQPALFLKALNFEGMSVVNLIWNLTSSVSVTLIGILYFGEKIKGLRLVAVLMALFSLILFALTDS
jgi:multidrug transporter EmrE-like cation transporter